MNHEHMGLDPNKCTECGYESKFHGSEATCESCSNTGNLESFGLGNKQAFLCRDCRESERILLEKQIQINEELKPNGINIYGVPNDGEERVLLDHAVTRPYIRAISEARRIDEQSHLDSDIFTAKTVSIESIRKEIWNDDTIDKDKKFFEFVAFCKSRIRHFQKVIFELDKKKIEAYSEQKAWHVAMNQFANHLTVTEREALRINDINYDVKMPKVVTPKLIKLSKAKWRTPEKRKIWVAFNKELVAMGKEAMMESTFETMLLRKNWTPDQVVDQLRKQIKEGLPETN